MSVHDLKTTTGQADFRHVDHWVFDLDNTLYDASSGVFPQIDRNMRGFLMKEFDLDEPSALIYQKDLYRDYGTTLAGLMARHKLDPARFLDHVHDVDASELQRDESLIAALKRLPGRKAIFTNADRRHAENIAARLGILDQFDAIFDIVSSEYRPKPDPDAYDKVLTHYGATGRRAAMFEDLKRNLKPAALLGMTTVWISNAQPYMHAEPGEDDHIHHVADALTAFLDDIHIGDTP